MSQIAILWLSFLLSLLVFYAAKFVRVTKTEMVMIDRTTAIRMGQNLVDGEAGDEQIILCQKGKKVIIKIV